MATLARRIRFFNLPNLRAALWTLRATHRARRWLGRNRFDAVPLPPVPELPPSAGRGVVAVLTRRRDSCLVRATVRQAWYVSQGEPRDLVIGVTSPGAGFRAHAWLEGDPPCHDEIFHELSRRPVEA